MSNKKFEAFKKRSKGPTERKWFSHCEQEKIPYVIVSMRTKYADISFDYISLPKEYDVFLTNHAVAIWNEARAIFEKYATKKSKIRGGGGLIINFENIPIENAEFAANELFDLINLYLKKFNKNRIKIVKIGTAPIFSRRIKNTAGWVEVGQPTSFN